MAAPFRIHPLFFFPTCLLLLSSAGYSLSDSDTFDLVIQFCLEKKIYDFYDINQALDYFRLNPLI